MSRPEEHIGWSCNPNLSLYWSNMFLRRPDNSNYMYFTKGVMKVAYMLIYGVTPPRILQEGKILLQFSLDKRARDWFLYENHIVTWVYYFKDDPYKLWTFITIIILAMEYTRYKFIPDGIYFRNFRKHRTFLLCKDIGPF